MDLSIVLEEVMSNFTEQERKIYQYIMGHSAEVSRLTSQELANRCFVSRPTISRFIKKLGLESYAELKFLLKNKPLKQRTTSDFSSVLEQYHHYINQVFSHSIFSRLAQVLVGVEVLYLYGTGNEQKLEVEFMRHLFAKLGMKIIVFFDKGEYDYIKAHLTQGDALIVVSYKGENQNCLSMVLDAQSHGVSTIALTRTSQNSLARLADYQLFVPTDSLQVNTERTYEISTTFYFMIEELYLACVRLVKE